MKAPSIENVVIDEANQRTYIILAPRVLSDGEMYRAIRQEILRRGGKSLAPGETLTLTLTSNGTPARQPAATAAESPGATATLPPAQENQDVAKPEA